MTEASVNDPCECGQTSIRGCADMPSRHCGAWEQPTQPAVDIDRLIAEMREGFEKVNHGPHQLDITNEDRCSGLIDHIWRCSPASIRALLDEIERLRADNARLQEALAPFRVFADHIIYCAAEFPSEGSPFRDPRNWALPAPWPDLATAKDFVGAMEASNG
jgi:hypothetical protein